MYSIAKYSLPSPLVVLLLFGCQIDNDPPFLNPLVPDYRLLENKTGNSALFVDAKSIQKHQGGFWLIIKAQDSAWKYRVFLSCDRATETVSPREKQRVKQGEYWQKHDDPDYEVRGWCDRIQQLLKDSDFAPNLPSREPKKSKSSSGFQK